MKCPNCDGLLQRVPEDHDADTAPLMCEPCARGWWEVEVSPMAAGLWNKETRSFRHGEAFEMLRLTTDVEREDRRKAKADKKGKK